METSKAVNDRPVRDLMLVGGNLVLDFANTIDDPHGRLRFDHVGSYSLLVEWSSRVGVLSPEQRDSLRQIAGNRRREATRALGRAHELRAIVVSTFTEIAGGGVPSPADWAGLQAFAADAIAHADLAWGHGAFELTWSRTDALDGMLRPIAQAAVDLLTSPELSRLKRCVGCPWLFLDHSKNLSRRWCAMEVCGRDEKIRRYLTRRVMARGSRAAS